jgi:hypothetical protein
VSESILGLTRHQRRYRGLTEAGFLRPRDAERLSFAVADPPYPGMSYKIYGDHPDFAGEVDHPALIERLCDEYDDGWVLFSNGQDAAALAGLMPPQTRLLAWIKPDSEIFPGVSVTKSWEPIYVWRGRRRPIGAVVLRDYIVCTAGEGRPKDAIKGYKPERVCKFVFDHLGASALDSLVDLFPGSGAVGRAWELHQAQGRLIT